MRAGAAIASLGALLSLLAGVGRTAFAMADAGDLPRGLAAVHPTRRIPHRATAAAAALVAVVAALADVRSAIGFSSFAVLVYYGVANAAAWTLPRAGPLSRLVPAAGIAGCALLAASLPLASVLGGAGVLLAGAAGYALRRRASPPTDRGGGGPDLRLP